MPVMLEMGLYFKRVRKDVPIAYASGTLNQVECSYSVTERETLAVMFGLKRFCRTALGNKVHVISGY